MTAATPPPIPAQRDAQGYLLQDDQWSSRVAEDTAHDNGIEDLTSRHWQVINAMRDAYADHGASPWIRMISRVSGVPIKELYRLFPRGPSRLVAKIAGIPKRRACI